MTAEPLGGFTEFYAEQFDRRVGQALKKFGIGYQDAQDIVQESLIELMPKWGTDKALDPGALLTTIIQRKVFKRWGRRSAAAPVVPLEEEVYRLEAAIADPAVTAEQRDTIRRAASFMSPIERRIVLGRARQDSAVTIATEAGVSAEAVRSTRRRLQQRMTAAAEIQETAPDLGTIDLAEYIKGLPNQQGKVLTLALEGYWPAEIAKMLEITSNDARVNLHYAKKTVIGLLPATADAQRRIPFMIRWARRRADSALAPRSGSTRPPGMLNQARRPA